MRRVLLILMKTVQITILASLVACVFALPTLAQDVDSKIIKVNFGESVSRIAGSDGRVIIYPSAWTSTQGSDGRVVAYPLGWKTIEGRDGRIVAVPDTNPVPLYFDDPTVVAKILDLDNGNNADSTNVAIFWWINQDD